MKKIVLLSLILACVFSQKDLTGLKALGAPLNHKVNVRWNRFYDYDAIKKIVYRIIGFVKICPKFDRIVKKILGFVP